MKKAIDFIDFIDNHPLSHITLFLTIFSLSISYFAQSCVQKVEREKKNQVLEYVIVKKKYSEQTVTKDIVFGTDNWFSMDYYIVDQNNKVWSFVDKETYIICDVGDTLWVTNSGRLILKK